MRQWLYALCAASFQLSAASIHNPVLPGFNPDPSLIRAGDDYYIATSTFEWFPGVQIHHSKDMVHWRLVTRPLDRVSQLDMAGIGNSYGVWAPALSYHDDQFYLIYTNTKTRLGPYDDVDNFLVTAKNIEGPWSEPIALNHSGFDPSLFHDEDGRKWLVNMRWDWRPGKRRFAGIDLQEYNPEKKKLVGPVHHIFDGTKYKVTEGPHLYQKDGYYYLVTAEGGTNWNHTFTVARSKNITGPYEVHPENPLLNANHTSNPLQKTGHGTFVQTQTGEWYLSHLTSRPLMLERETKPRRSILGRETAIQKVVWPQGEWPRLAQGGQLANVEVPAPNLPAHPWPKPDTNYQFDSSSLPIDFQTLRVPLEKKWGNTTERPGWLRLHGRESLASPFYQTHVARRLQAFHTRVTTKLDFKPYSYKQLAGLTAFYDTQNHYALMVNFDEEQGGRCLRLLRADAGTFHPSAFADGIQALPLPPTGDIYLRAEINQADLQFSYSMDGKAWQKAGPLLDASVLSDEYADGFTGAFYGLSAHDLLVQDTYADFDFFNYEEL